MKPISIAIEIHELPAEPLYESLIKKYDEKNVIIGEVAESEQQAIKNELAGKVYYFCRIQENSLGIGKNFKSQFTTQENRTPVVKQLFKLALKSIEHILDHPDYNKESEEPPKIITIGNN